MASILYLTPADWRGEPPAADALLAALRGAAVAGAPLPFAGRTHHRPGERFLQSVTFLGCSPVIALGEPGATGEEFCHIEIEASCEPRLVSSEITREPRCPHCRSRIGPWRAWLSGWKTAPLTHAAACPHCGTAVNAADLEWRQVAGAGRLFLKLWGVFEGEAVPGDELLALLHGVSGGPWRHFYFRGEA